MAAPKGNQFWKLAQNAGRPRNFESPEELWEKACEYFAWCDENPIYTVEYNGKDAVECQVPKMRAYTWAGLEYFCNVNSFENYKRDYKEFSDVITRIEKVLYAQKFTGAAAGVLNANIIARDLGLAEKSVNETNHTVSEEVLKSIADKLNS